MRTPEYSLKLENTFNRLTGFFLSTGAITALCIRLLMLLALWMLLGQSQSAHAQLPVDPSVTHGNAVIDAAGTHMSITNSPDTIINWQDFSIGSDHSVHFQQQNAASQVLNRVTGNDPSEILGSLSSNGGVWLINPHGVLFGEGARIDVGGLVASTLDISNLDFLANNYHFNATENGSGNVLNQGEIRTSLGGRVWMTGEQVQNEGLIQSPQGHVVLAAGKSVELIDSGAPNVVVRVSAPENEAINLGAMVTTNGQVDVHGSIVNQQGIIRADSLTTDTSGRIVLTASDSLTMAENGLIQANEVNLRADREVLLEGRIDASNPQGQGGKIEVTGDSVALLNADIDASGGTQGGTVHLGGGWQGTGDLPHAREVIVGVGSEVKASGDEHGGEIAVWSTQSSDHYGLLEARDGGRIELSSKGVIRHHGDIVTGPGGHVLFDPKDLYIIDGRLDADDDGTIDVDGIDFNNDGIPDRTLIDPDIATFDFNPDKDSFISNSLITRSLGNQTDVTLQAKNDIFVQSDINLPPSGFVAIFPSGGNLTLQAGHNITFADDVIVHTRNGNLTAIAGDIGALPNLQDSSIPTLTINQGASLNVGSGTATLAAVNGNFKNNNGDAAILTTRAPSVQTSSDPPFTPGRWLIYAADPDKTPSAPLSTKPPDTPGTIEEPADFAKRYNQPYDVNTPDDFSSGNWFLYSVAPVLHVAPAPDGQTITYGGTVPTFNPVFRDEDLIGGDEVTTLGVIDDLGTANFRPDGPRSSSNNTTAGSHDVVYTNGLVSTLGYQFADDATSNNELTVDKKPLTASGFAAQDKIYDATTEARLVPGLGVPIGDLPDDDVSLSGASGIFADPNVGANKLVTVTDASIVGADADNYVFSPAQATTQATITKAALTYNADQVVSLAGLPELNLTGKVSGFVGNDTLENATTGSVQWITTATAESPPGVYKITGQGLDATNYQLASNETPHIVQSYNNHHPEVKLIQDEKTSIDGTKPIIDFFPKGRVIDDTSRIPLWRTYGKLSTHYYKSGQPNLAIIYGKLAVNTIHTLSSIDYLDDKIRIHEQLILQLIEQDRIPEVRFYVLPMIKRLEYNFFSGGQSADIFPRKIPYSPPELKVEEPFVAHLAKKIKGGTVDENKNLTTFSDLTFTSGPIPEGTDASENGGGPAGAADIISDAISPQSAASSIQPSTAHVQTSHFNQMITARNNQISDSIEQRMENETRETRFPADLKTITRTTGYLNTLKNDLQENVALLFYIITDHELIVLLCPPNDISHCSDVQMKPISRTELNRLISEFREKLSRANSDVLTQAKGLYDLLIKPIKVELDELKPKTLAIYQTGALRYMPFAALNDGEKYLIEDYALTTYLESKLGDIVEYSPSSQWSIAAFGVTKPYGTFSPLPAVEFEINSIVKENLTHEKYLDDDFTLAQLENAGANPDINVLHLATHFKLASTKEHSFLLAGGGKNIPLRAFESFNLSTKELVTLSACETAFGNLGSSVSGGKEVESLALTVFEDSNADSVLATLWNVADHTTAVLVEQFYQFRENNLSEDNLSKAKALQKAQLHFIKGHVARDKTSQDNRGVSRYAVDTESHNDSTKHPYYWAPFILMGNWL